MLGPGRYSQWRSRFLRYLDTKSNGEYLRKCIFEGPYTPTNVLIAAVEAAENILPVAVMKKLSETIHNMTTENKLYFQAEKEAIFLILTGIGDEIYSTVDACNTAKEMWTAIERLQQGESLNVLRFNDIRSERLARSVNPLALLAAAQPYSDNYYQAPKPQRSNAPSYMQSSSTRPSASTRHKGKEIAKPVTPQSESVSEEDSDPEQARRDKDMKKNLALLLRTRTEDTTQGITMTISQCSLEFKRRSQLLGPRKQKPKRVKDYAYHKEKMMMCKQAEQGVPLQAEQADWLEDTDEEIDEQELEAHYSYMAKIQEVSPEETSSTSQPLEQVQNHDENDVFANMRRHSEQPESINDTYVLEKDDSNVIPDSSNICTNDNQVDQNAAECVDERAALANLIANLTLDTEENKTVLKQLKKANASLTQELKECKTNLDESSRALGEATSSRDSSLIALQTKQTELEKYTALNDLTSDYKILQTKLNDTLGLLAIKDIDIQEGLKTKTYEISVVNQKHEELVKKSLLNRSQFEGQLKEKSKIHIDTSDPANRFCPNGEETVTLEKESRSKLDKEKNLPQIKKTISSKHNFIAPGPSRITKAWVISVTAKEFVGSNDMVHNYYLEKAKEKCTNFRKTKNERIKPSMIGDPLDSNTANVANQNLGIGSHQEYSVSNQRCSLRTHMKQKPFLKFNELQCPTCKKCLYSANHDECVLEYISRLNPCASAHNKDAKSHKTTKRYMPVENSSASKKPERQIPQDIGGFPRESYSTLARARLTVNPRMVQE
ncbi:hypothetical protein Tco_0040505 [Tanacetum coccineum]